MKIAVTLIVAASLTGCATPPSFLAAMYDNNDPCQFQNIKGNSNNEKVANMPSFCGAGSKRQTVYVTRHGQPLGAPAAYVNSR